MPPRFDPGAVAFAWSIVGVIGFVAAIWLAWRVMDASTLDGRPGDFVDQWRVARFLARHTDAGYFDRRSLRVLRVTDDHICGMIWRHYTPKYANRFDFDSSDEDLWYPLLYSINQRGAYTPDRGSFEIFCGAVAAEQLDKLTWREP